MENENLENEIPQQTETVVENQENNTNDSPSSVPSNEVLEDVPQAGGDVSEGENNENTSSVGGSENNNSSEGDSDPDNGSEGDSDPDNGSVGDSDPDNGFLWS